MAIALSGRNAASSPKGRALGMSVKFTLNEYVLLFRKVMTSLTAFSSYKNYFSISLYSHSSASETPPSWSMSFSLTARRPSRTVPTSITSSPVRSISSV